MPPRKRAAAASRRQARQPTSSDEEKGSSALEVEAEADAESTHSDEEPAPKKRKTRTSSGTAAEPAAKAKSTGVAKGGSKASQAPGTGTKARTKAKAKGGKESTEEEADADAQPTNKVLPAQISFAPKAAGTVRIATWNICGLAAAQKKGFKYYVEAEDADILILTETKVNNDTVDPALAQRYPYRHWAISAKKSYSGTAILSKVKPLSVDDTLPGHPDPAAVKGRIVTVEFESCYLVGTYVVNAGTGLKTLDAKKEWNAHFEGYIRELDKKKPVIWAGDLNVAPTAIDLANPKPNWNKTPGYTEAETSSFARILNGTQEESETLDGDTSRFVDVWRKRHPDVRHYTYFSYRFNCREKGIGWRLDMFVVSERLEERVKMCEIRSEIYGASDHCPVVLELAGPL